MTHTTICNLVAGEWFCLDWPRLVVLVVLALGILAALLVERP